MAWTTGTATDWQDLLDDLRAFADANGWDVDRYATSVGGDANVDELIIHSTTLDVYVGVRTFYDSSADARNWELVGGTGYNSGASVWQDYMVGISPGRYNGATSAERAGAYLCLQNASTAYWLSVTARRIILVAKCGTDYEWMHLGLLNPYGTAGEYPYPLYIAGSTPTYNTRFNSAALDHSGLADPQANLAAENGPAFLRLPSGAWRSIRNGVISGGNRIASNGNNVFPCGRPLSSAAVILDPADRWVVDGTAHLRFADIIPSGNQGTTQTFKLYKSPDSGGDKAPLFPCAVVCAPDTNERLLGGEVGDAFWLSVDPGPTDGGIVSEDTITIGANTYHVFQMANRTDTFNYCCVLEG